MIKKILILGLIGFYFSCDLTKTQTADQINPLQNGDYTFTYKDEKGLQQIERLLVSNNTITYWDKNGVLGGDEKMNANGLNPGHVKDGKFNLRYVGSSALAKFQYTYKYYQGDFYGIGDTRNKELNPHIVKDYTMEMFSYPIDASAFYVVEYEEQVRRNQFEPRKQLLKVSYSGRDSVVQTLILRESGVMFANEQIEGQTYEDPNAPLPPCPENMVIELGGNASDTMEADINKVLAMENKPRIISDKSWYKQ